MRMLHKISAFFWTYGCPFRPQCIFIFPLCFICSYCRPKDAEIEKIQKQQRGQTASDGLHGRAAPEAEDGVPGEPLHHGAAAAVFGHGAQPQRVSDQNLVSEQASQDKKGQRL